MSSFDLSPEHLAHLPIGRRAALLTRAAHLATRRTETYMREIPHGERSRRSAAFADDAAVAARACSVDLDNARRCLAVGDFEPAEDFALDALYGARVCARYVDVALFRNVSEIAEAAEQARDLALDDAAACRPQSRD